MTNERISEVPLFDQILSKMDCPLFGVTAVIRKVYNLMLFLAQSAIIIDHRGLTTVQSVTFASSNEIIIVFLLALASVKFSNEPIFYILLGLGNQRHFLQFLAWTCIAIVWALWRICPLLAIVSENLIALLL